MKKWIGYLIFLSVAIVIVTSSVCISKAGFLIVEDTTHKPQPEKVDATYHAYTLKEKYSQKFYGNEPIKPFAITKEQIPSNLVWLDGADQKSFSSPNAKRGGTYYSFLTTYPKCFRQIGPNANTAFRGILDNNDLSLLDLHPVTMKAIPALAASWAVAQDGRTVYYKIDHDARWSDGVPITADDWIFNLKLMRASSIIAPWYNTYYSEQIEEILKFDDYTIAIRRPTAKPFPAISNGLSPQPYHYFGNMRKTKEKRKNEKLYRTLELAKQRIPDNLTYFAAQDHLKPITTMLEKSITLLDAGTVIKKNIEKNKADDTAKLLSFSELRKISEILKDFRTYEPFISTNMSNLEKSKIYINALVKVSAKLANSGFVPNMQATNNLNDKLLVLAVNLENLKNKINNCKSPKDVSIELEVDDVCEDWVKEYNWKVRPFSGPYQVCSYMHNKWVKFKRNENWWANDKKFYVNRYNPDYKHYKLISNIDIAFEYFGQSRIDVFNLNDARFWYNKAASLKGYKRGYIYKTLLYNNIPRPSRLLSMNLSDKQLQDKNVRLGIAHSLNLKAMIELTMLGDATQAQTLVSGYEGFSNLKCKARDFNIEKAIDHFVKAGYSKKSSDGIRYKGDGKTKEALSFKLLFANASDKSSLMVLQEMAKRAGLHLELETFDPNTVFKKMLSKKHQLAWHGWAAGSNVFGPQYWGQYHSANANKPQTNNFTNLADKKLDNLIDKYRASSDSEERFSLSCTIQQDIYNHCCTIPTFYTPFRRSANWRWIIIPDCAELPQTDTILHYGLYWIDEDIKRETLKAMKSGKTFPKEFRVYDKYRPQR